MRRQRSPQEIRRLKELGAFDPGTYYLTTGFGKKPKQVYWDKDDDQDG